MFNPPPPRSTAPPFLGPPPPPSSRPQPPPPPGRADAFNPFAKPSMPGGGGTAGAATGPPPPPPAHGPTAQRPSQQRSPYDFNSIAGPAQPQGAAALPPPQTMQPPPQQHPSAAQPSMPPSQEKPVVPPFSMPQQQQQQPQQRSAAPSLNSPAAAASGNRSEARRTPRDRTLTTRVSGATIRSPNTSRAGSGSRLPDGSPSAGNFPTTTTAEAAPALRASDAPGGVRRGASGARTNLSSLLNRDVPSFLRPSGDGATPAHRAASHTATAAAAAASGSSGGTPSYRNRGEELLAAALRRRGAAGSTGRSDSKNRTTLESPVGTPKTHIIVQDAASAAALERHTTDHRRAADAPEKLAAPPPPPAAAAVPEHTTALSSSEPAATSPTDGAAKRAQRGIGSLESNYDAVFADPSAMCSPTPLAGVPVAVHSKTLSTMSFFSNARDTPHHNNTNNNNYNNNTTNVNGIGINDENANKDRNPYAPSVAAEGLLAGEVNICERVAKVDSIRSGAMGPLGSPEHRPFNAMVDVPPVAPLEDHNPWMLPSEHNSFVPPPPPPPAGEDDEPAFTFVSEEQPAENPFASNHDSTADCTADDAPPTECGGPVEEARATAEEMVPTTSNPFAAMSSCTTPRPADETRMWLEEESPGKAAEGGATPITNPFAAKRPSAVSLPKSVDTPPPPPQQQQQQQQQQQPPAQLSSADVSPVKQMPQQPCAPLARSGGNTNPTTAAPSDEDTWTTAFEVPAATATPHQPALLGTPRDALRTQHDPPRRYAASPFDRSAAAQQADYYVEPSPAPQPPQQSAHDDGAHANYSGVVDAEAFEESTLCNESIHSSVQATPMMFSNSLKIPDGQQLDAVVEPLPESAVGCAAMSLPILDSNRSEDILPPKNRSETVHMPSAGSYHQKDDNDHRRSASTDENNYAHNPFLQSAAGPAGAAVTTPPPPPPSGNAVTPINTATASSKSSPPTASGTPAVGAGAAAGATASLVNPFAKAASSVESASLRPRPRRSRAPCFVVFHPTGRGVIACFNQPVRGAAQQGQAATTATTPRKSHIVSIPTIDAMEASGSVVDREDLKGSEAGRRYAATIKALAQSPFFSSSGREPSSLLTLEVANQLLSTMTRGTRAPIHEILAVMLADVLKPDTEPFLWSEGGRKILSTLLLRAAPKHTAAPVNTVIKRLSEAERDEGLVDVQRLLCEGEREAAVEAALSHQLYAHAVLIAMMCPKKDEYMSSIQALVERELQSASPLSHAYCLFNDMPLPPFTAPIPPSPEAILAGSFNSNSVISSNTKSHAPRTQRREQLQATWAMHAATLVSNFAKSSGDGLIHLGDTLQQCGLMLESHACFLLAHLCPLGSPAALRAHAAPEAASKVPRQEQLRLMDQLRPRLGVLGGFYHPVDSCRAAFLTPETTLLTDFLQEVRVHLDARAPPLVQTEGVPPVAFHGLPARPPRYTIAFHFMQAMWMAEAGVRRAGRSAMNAVCTQVPDPSVPVGQAPPSTLNELVQIFGQPLWSRNTRAEEKVEPPPQQQQVHATTITPPAAAAPTTTPTPPMSEGVSDRASPSGSQQSPLGPPLPQQRPSSGPPMPGSAMRSSPQSPTQVEHIPGPGAPPPPAGAKTMPPPPAPTGAPPPSMAGAPPPPMANGPPPPPQGKGKSMPPGPPSQGPPGPHMNGAGAPPPPPPQQHQHQHQHPSLPPSGSIPPPQSLPRSSAAPSPGGQPLAPIQQEVQQQQQQPSRGRQVSHPNPQNPENAAAAPKPRSRSLDTIRNFFRRSKAPDEPPEKAAKPMILDTEKPPQFDPVSGRWLFEQTDEEKAQEAMIKAGPPKMASPTGGPPAGGGPPGAGPLSKGPPPGPPGKRPPGQRPQYVDMFNSS